MSEKKIVLKNSDGESFEVNEAVALKSKKIADIIEQNGTGDAIPINRRFKGNIFELVNEYCKKHVESDESLIDETKADLKKWDTEFMKMEPNTLLDVLVAADYLKINDLIDLCCQTIGDIMEGKTAKELRKEFNVWNTLTEEEKEEIYKNHPWIFTD